MVPFALLEKTRGSWVEVPVLIWVIAFSLLKVSSTAHVVFCFPPFLTPMCCGALHFQAAAMLWLRRDQGSKKPHVSQPFPPWHTANCSAQLHLQSFGSLFQEKRGKRDILVLSPHSPWRGFCWGAPLKMCVCARLWDANCSASQPVLEGIILKQGWKSPELSAFHTDTGCQGSCFMKQAGIMGLHYPEVGWKPVLHAVNPFIALRSRAHACCF